VTPVQLLASNDLLRALDLMGVVVMGITGGSIARGLRFDPVGFAAIGIVSGLGGGILRDVILDQGVPAAFDGPWYLVCALAGAGFSFLVAADGTAWRRLMVGLDATALGLWAATGTLKSLAAGLDVLAAILLGIVSAVGGGAIRDLLVGRIPVIFGGGPLYATSALVTATGAVLVQALHLPGALVLVAVVLGTSLAILSQWRSWGLPSHQDWQVTLSASQMRTMVRRVRRSERRRVARETGAIPVLPPDAADGHLVAEDLGSAASAASASSPRSPGSPA